MADIEEEEDEEVEQTKEKKVYDHPVYKEISLTNGKINSMKKDEVKKILIKFSLDSRYSYIQVRKKSHVIKPIK